MSVPRAFLPAALCCACAAFAVGAAPGPPQASTSQPPAPPILQEPQTILLWPGGAPGAQGGEDRDKPALTVYMPPNTTGPMTAVIIAPGGGYQRLSMNLEGRAPANFLNALGIAAFVLRYRLGPEYHHPVERDAGHLGDAAGVHLPHECRHDGAGRKRGGLLSGSPEGGCAGGDARVQGGAARHWPRHDGPGARRMAEAARELAARERIPEMIRAALMRQSRRPHDHLGRDAHDFRG